jgi:hypothetical protein
VLSPHRRAVVSAQSSPRSSERARRVDRPECCAPRRRPR